MAPRTVLLSAACVLVAGCFGGSSDDAGSGESAASAVDPRSRSYVFEVEASKLPACTQLGCSFQVRLKTYGRFSRVVSESCLTYDLSGRKAVRGANEYAALETDKGAIVGVYDSTGFNGESAQTGLLGDVEAVEISLEEGSFVGAPDLDRMRCGTGVVRHSVKTRFDEEKNAERTSDLTHITFGSHVGYVFGRDALTFTPKSCSGDTALMATCASADGGAPAPPAPLPTTGSRDAGAPPPPPPPPTPVPDAGADDASAAPPPDPTPPPTTPPSSSSPSSPSESSSSPGTGGQPETVPADGQGDQGGSGAPAPKQDSRPPEHTPKAMSGCAIAGAGAPTSTPAPAPFALAVALGLAAVAARRRRERARA